MPLITLIEETDTTGDWKLIVSIVSLIISCLGIPTLATLLVTDIHNKRKENSQQAKDVKKKELMDGVKEVVKEEIQPIKDDIKDIKLKVELSSAGTLASLRNDLLDCYYECCNKGYRTADDIKNWQDMLEAYHNLGGNSFITEINLLFSKLDSEEQHKEKMKKKVVKPSKKKKQVLLENN
jgi:hypothetical protein